MNESNYRDKIVAVLSRYPQVKRAILFGSRAKGIARDGSDIDLALEGEALGRSTLLSIEESVDDLCLPVKIDLLLLDSSTKDSLREHIGRVGVEWYRV